MLEEAEGLESGAGEGPLLLAERLFGAYRGGATLTMGDNDPTRVEREAMFWRTVRWVWLVMILAAVGLFFVVREWPF